LTGSLGSKGSMKILFIPLWQRSVRLATEGMKGDLSIKEWYFRVNDGKRKHLKI
jgi:hypothetical protein